MATSPRAGKRLVSFVNREELSSLEFNISEVERPTKAAAAGLCADSPSWLNLA